MIYFDSTKVSRVRIQNFKHDKSSSEGRLSGSDDLQQQSNIGEQSGEDDEHSTQQLAGNGKYFYCSCGSCDNKCRITFDIGRRRIRPACRR